MATFSQWIIKKVGKYLTKKVYPLQNYLCDFHEIQKRLRVADVVLVSGRSRVSYVIRYITNSPWSHTALYIGRIRDIDDPELIRHIRRHYNGRDDTQLLIESELGSGTVLVPLNKYNKEHVRIARPTALTPEDAQTVIAHAMQSLGKKYNTRHIFDLFRLLAPYGILPRRLGSTLFSHHADKPTEDICSSMIADSFRVVNFPILPLVTYTQNYGYELTRRNPKLFTPSDFDFSPYFDIIKYPIFGPTDRVPYKNLRWREDEISHH